MNYDKLALKLHKKYHGKITLALKDNSQLNRDKLSAYYTPGVAALSRAIAANPADLPTYTWTNNLVAVISDGSAVLGLGKIGAKAALPVMEGKALLFKYFADINAIPIVINTHDTNEIVNIIKRIAPSFGAINLEDFAAPQCFEIEDRLKQELDIPVMHDDQHGTAIVVLAGLINACKVTGRDLNKSRVIFSGVGAAGVAIMRLLKTYAPSVSIIAVDSQGVISRRRQDLNKTKLNLLKNKIISDSSTNSLADALVRADIFVGVSKPNLVALKMIKAMNKKAIVFALANPTPEITPNEAKKGGAVVVATGRSDFPNQINNALAFPGIFRGALDHGVQKITEQHKLAAAEAIAALVKKPTTEAIIPSIFDNQLVTTVASVIK
jgi:malate dehydrogenase (oxaloacetate-decarboxylating)